MEDQVKRASWFLVLAALSACSFAQTPPKPANVPSAAECLKVFLASNSAWRARRYEVSDQRKEIHGVDSFAPITMLWVRNGILYARTWSSEGLPIEASVDSRGVKVNPKYLVWLGGDDEIGSAAKRVAKYSDAAVTHRLEIIGACGAPEILRISIGRWDESNRALDAPETITFGRDNRDRQRSPDATK